MQKSIVFITAILINSIAFASSVSPLNQNSTQLKSLGSAFKEAHPLAPLDKNDITMVYGGEDISRKPTIVQHVVQS